MKQEDLRRKARKELSALSLVGISDVSAVRKALETQDKEKPSIVENTTVETTMVASAVVEDVSGASVDICSNYHKFDNDVSDILTKYQTLAEQVVYHRLYRLSYGYNKNTCQVGMGALAKACNIGSSNKTVKNAIEGLVAKGHIAVIEDHKNNKNGTRYRVFLPCEIPGIESSTTVKITTV